MQQYFESKYENNFEKQKPVPHQYSYREFLKETTEEQIKSLTINLGSYALSFS